MVFRLIAVLAMLSTMALSGCGDTDAEFDDNVDAADTVQPTPADGGRVSVELATVSLADGRQVVLRSFEPKGATTGPCLWLIGIDDEKRGCGRAPSERDPPLTHEPVVADSMAQIEKSAPLEVFGATSPDAAEVRLKFELRGSKREAPATLIHPEGEALDEAGIAEPFGYFFGELPSDATDISAKATDADGETLGSASFDFLRSQHPQAFIPGVGGG